MKKIKLSKKLKFDKVAISKLDENQLSKIMGGFGSTDGQFCSCCRNTCGSY